MKDLPKFLRPPTVRPAISNGMVEWWVEDCIEYKIGCFLPSGEYLESFQEWSGMLDYPLRSLNKILRGLGSG